MTKIKTVLLALVAVFAFSAVAAGSASAHEWLLDGLPITKAVAVKSHGELLLSDAKGGPLGEKVAIKCKGTDEGTVGPGAADLISNITATECVREEGSCPTPITANALHLPWKTELYLGLPGEIRDLISEDGKGVPGWDVVCGGFIEDECTGNTSTSMTNVVGSGVNATFDAMSEEVNCTRGGTGSGTVTGTDLNENPVGHEIEVS